MNRWFAERVVRQAESTVVEGYPRLEVFPPERPSAPETSSPHRSTTAGFRHVRHISHGQLHTIKVHEDRRAEWLENPTDSPGTSASPHRNPTAGSRHAQQPRDKGTADRSKASGSTTAAGLARHANSDGSGRMTKHIRFARPPSHHSPAASAATASVLPRIAKPSPNVPPIDDRQPSSSVDKRMAVCKPRPSDDRGASETTSKEGPLSRRAHVSGMSLGSSSSSSSLEEGQSALAHCNEPPPRPRSIPSLPARTRQDKRKPADSGAIEACDAAGWSLLSASLQRYASIEASTQGASAYVTDNIERERPSPSSFNSWRDKWQLPQRRPYRDIHGGKLRSST
jgi:hypothetical protein